MSTLALVLQLLAAMPVIQIGTPDPAPPAAAQAGTGTLLIAACPPGATITVQPGSLAGIADKDGVARIQAPAQATGADPYTFSAAGDPVEFHGTLSKGESLSAVCP